MRRLALGRLPGLFRTSSSTLVLLSVVPFRHQSNTTSPMQQSQRDSTHTNIRPPNCTNIDGVKVYENNTMHNYYNCNNWRSRYNTIKHIQCPCRGGGIGPADPATAGPMLKQLDKYTVRFNGLAAAKWLAKFLPAQVQLSCQVSVCSLNNAHQRITTPQIIEFCLAIVNLLPPPLPCRPNYKTCTVTILQLHAHGTKHYTANILQLNTCKHMEQETSTTKTVSFGRLDVKEDILIIVHNSEAARLTQQL